MRLAIYSTIFIKRCEFSWLLGLALPIHAAIGSITEFLLYMCNTEYLNKVMLMLHVAGIEN